MADHLTLRYGVYHARLDIPKDVRKALGNKTSFRKSLRTGDRRKAKALAAECVTRWKYQIEEARGSLGYLEEARALRTQLLTADEVERDQILEYVSERAEAVEAEGSLDPSAIHDGTRPQTTNSDQALRFYEVAIGKATPVHEYVVSWLSELHVGKKTKVEYERALKDLDGHFEYLHQVNRRTASEFIRGPMSEGRKRQTVDKKVTALASYWKWLSLRGYLDEHAVNPWADQRLSKGSREDVVTRRAFDEDEAKELLRLIKTTSGKNSDDYPVSALMAVTGLRLEEAADLRCRDISEVVKPCGFTWLAPRQSLA